jgi:hypothetical protein
LTSAGIERMIDRRVTRAIVIFTAAWFLALGCGAAERLHHAAHAREDQSSRPAHAPPPVHHDDSNCALHAALRAPLLSTPAVLLLICAGLLVAFVSELPAPGVRLRLIRSIDCRGPPRIA